MVGVFSIVLFRFLVAFYFISVWPHITWSHVLWAAFIAVMTWPLKKLWDLWVGKFWEAFKTSFMAGFKNTPEGREFLNQFYKARAEKDVKIVHEHPELAKMLKHKDCDGKGCEDCGGTGWA